MKFTRDEETLGTIFHTTAIVCRILFFSTSWWMKDEDADKIPSDLTKPILLASLRGLKDALEMLNKCDCWVGDKPEEAMQVLDEMEKWWKSILN